MKSSNLRNVLVIAMTTVFLSCTSKSDQAQLQKELKLINLERGDITLCGAAPDQFGSVSFSLACSEEVQDDFNLATALLHSFEYTEAEKVFVRIAERDPKCAMAYWGIAMSNFHALWVPPSAWELEKGSKIIALGRSVVNDKSSRESSFLEAIACIYDSANVLNHRTRVLKYEKAMEKVYEKNPENKEAAIFYSLALNASADPGDKTFANQKKAGRILEALFERNPNHPGIAHYLIHNYDYPELAEMGLPAARKYASIATASAHAQHMPSHIFTRLGLWEECIASNLKSVSAAQCHAERSALKGHWDEELHGLDYLMYGYLQKADDAKALNQLQYLNTINEVSPVSFKDAYTFAAMPARYAVERKDWSSAKDLELLPTSFPWEKFPWERSNIHFARLLGAVHVNQLTDAKSELLQLTEIYDELVAQKETYKSNLLMIQIKASNAWISLAEGKKKEAVLLMSESADMEDATAKHPVTPGEIIPARELLADMYYEMGDYISAAKQYELDLKTHPNRFNGLYGALLSYQKLGNAGRAEDFNQKLLAITNASGSDRPQMKSIKSVSY